VVPVPVVLVDQGMAIAAGDHVAVGQEGEWRQETARSPSGGRAVEPAVVSCSRTEEQHQDRTPSMLAEAMTAHLDRRGREFD